LSAPTSSKPQAATRPPYAPAPPHTDFNAEEVAILDQIDGLDYLLDTPKRGA